jgi:hypothetical protein
MNATTNHHKREAQKPDLPAVGKTIWFWFAVSSPLLGVLFGILATAILLSMIGEAMSITPIVFVLIILLFGLDSTGQDPPAPESRLRRSGGADKQRALLSA